MTSFDFISLIVAGVAVFFSGMSGFFLWKSGSGDVTKNVIDAYRERVDQLEERVKVCEGLHRENLTEVGRLIGMSEEKDKRIAVLESVDLKKNPELMKFIKDTSDALVSIKDFFNDMKSGKYVLVPGQQTNVL